MRFGAFCVVVRFQIEFVNWLLACSVLGFPYRLYFVKFLFTSFQKDVHFVIWRRTGNCRCLHCFRLSRCINLCETDSVILSICYHLLQKHSIHLSGPGLWVSCSLIGWCRHHARLSHLSKGYLYIIPFSNKTVHCVTLCNFLFIYLFCNLVYLHSKIVGILLDIFLSIYRIYSIKLCNKTGNSMHKLIPT